MADQKKCNMTNVTDSIRDYYESQHWKYRYDSESGVFRMFIQLRAEEIDACEVRTVVRDEERFTTFVTLPFKVPEKKRVLAAKFISSANYKLLLGCFEMDFRDGEIQYKTTCFCGNIRLEHQYIQRQVDVGIQMVEEYGPGLLDVLFRGASMEDALEKIEQMRSDREASD